MMNSAIPIIFVDVADGFRERSTHPKNFASSGLRCVGLMYPDLSRFPAEHRLLAGDAPVIAGERAAFAERAMAGHHERDRVFSDRGADRARGLRAIDLGRDIRIANRAAH